MSLSGSLLAMAIAVAAGLASWAGTGALCSVLQRRAILDHPNPRSSHDRPVPRGGGLAVLAAVLLAWALAIALLLPAPPHGWPRPEWVLVGAAFGLGAVSWIDDLVGLSAVSRLLVQAGAAALGLLALPDQALVFQGLLPFGPDRIVAWLAWIWFVNLYNFMDGIDGIAGAETCAIGLGVALAVPVSGAAAAAFLAAGEINAAGDGLLCLGLAPALAALGFLYWNWHPARIFLGDVGSVPLGYLLGWLLLLLAGAGYWAAALLLPLYYLADATWTLLHRTARGQKPWQAHREHFYQRALARFPRHDSVVLLIARANGVLLLLALASVLLPGLATQLVALAAGGLAVFWLLRHFAAAAGA